MLTLLVAGIPGLALAQDDEDGKKSPSMHELAHQNQIPKTHADFRQFRYRPLGDKVIEQPDAGRLLFRTRDGQPDGYAERRGSAVIYHDRTGAVVRVQPLDPDETTAH